MLVARCAQRISWLVQRRHISLSNISSSVWRNGWNRLKGFVNESERDNFDEEFIRKAHESDRLSEKDWLLIYRDQSASRLFSLVATAFPTLLIGLVVIAYDIYTNERRNRFLFVQRLLRDLEEIGLFAIFPGIAFVLVVATVFRMQQLRLMRIYQNRKCADEFLAIASKNAIRKHKINFNRDCASACYFAEEQQDLLRLLAHMTIGNMQIDKRRFLVSDEGFRGNNYRTYMLNETSMPPRL